MANAPEPARHRDPGARREDFLHDILVVCPRCSSRAHVVRHPLPDHVDGKEGWGDRVFGARRLTCEACDLVRSYPPPSSPATVSYSYVTLLESLPSWITSAKHRDEVLRVADRLLSRN